MCKRVNESDERTTPNVIGSGFVEFNEFVKMMSKTFDEPLTQEELKEAFRVFDVDNSGTITADELKQVVSKLGIHLSQEEINEMIKAADTSGDGQVQYAGKHQLFSFLYQYLILFSVFF